METVESVSRWAEETFGPTTPQATFDRAIQEIQELLFKCHLSASDPDVVEEAADVCITLYRYISLVDPEAIEKKMAINRKRKWKLNWDGTAQHVKSKEEVAADLMNRLSEFNGDERETNP